MRKFTPGDMLWEMGDVHFGERILTGESKFIGGALRI